MRKSAPDFSLEGKVTLVTGASRALDVLAHLPVLQQAQILSWGAAMSQPQRA